MNAPFTLAKRGTFFIDVIAENFVDLENGMIRSMAHFTTNFVPLSVHFLFNFSLQALELSTLGNGPLLSLLIQILRIVEYDSK